MNDLQKFGNLVKERRQASLLSQEALAATALGNPDRKGYISNIERGKRSELTFATVKKICEALQISIVDIPSSLHWKTVGDTTAQSTDTRDVQSSAAAMHPEDEKERHGSFQRQVIGLCCILVIIVFSDQILTGFSFIASTIFPEGSFSPLAFFAWSSAFLFLIFYFFGLEGEGAFTRARWLEYGTWQDHYLSVVNRTIAYTDHLFISKPQYHQLQTNSFGRNWSIGLYEKAWGFAILYPTAILLIQWAFVGQEINLGLVKLWPEEPDPVNRFIVAACLLFPIPLAYVARKMPGKLYRIGLCIIALAMIVYGSIHLSLIHWNILVGAGAMTMISFAFVLGIGLQLFNTVAGAVAAGGIAGASLSFLFIPLVHVSEFITGRHGQGYADPAVNTAHWIINHALLLIIFLVCLRLISRFLQPQVIQNSPLRGILIYATVTIGAAALMLIAIAQGFWFAYYFMIGLLPIVNAIFDFASIGVTRWALRAGTRQFGIKTLLYSILDLVFALALFLGLLFSTFAVASVLNKITDSNTFPFQTDVVSCIEGVDPLLSGDSHLSVKGISGEAGTCVNSIMADVASAPGDFTWLLIVFGSTLIPTVLHLGFALFALGPALLSTRLRLTIAGWSKNAASDPILRSGAAAFFASWLSIPGMAIVFVVYGIVRLNYLF